MSSYATLIARATRLVNDQGAHLSSDDEQDACREALTTYSIDVPRHVIEDESGNGTLYDFTLATAFTDRFSQIVSIEYPAGERPAIYLEPDEWTIYRTASTTRLRLQSITPSSGQTVRVTYTALHTVNGLDGAVTTTVPSWHLEALVCLIASRLLERLANQFIHDQEATILTADGVDRGSKAAEASKRARALEGDYRAMVGLARGVMPGGALVDWDASISGTGVDYLTHWKRHR